VPAACLEAAFGLVDPVQHAAEDPHPQFKFPRWRVRSLTPIATLAVEHACAGKPLIVLGCDGYGRWRLPWRSVRHWRQCGYGQQCADLPREVGEARADRSGWSQSAEFASLILDSGWAWAAMAVAVGWLVSKGVRPIVGVLLGALAGSVALPAATVVYDSLEALFQEGLGGGWRLRYWLILGLVVGLPLGAVGVRAWRRSSASWWRPATRR